ncbi:MAG: hypothetical protein L3J96_05375, partial [Thermoplasmata archaeon]|nr:hypothetical protein [Thermoplasmata archaeon]
SAEIIVNFTPINELTSQASLGGSVSPAGSSWVASGGTASIRAIAYPGYHFVGWTGTGPTSSSGASASISVTFFAPGPDWEFATFAPNASAVYVVTVTATGLLPGGSYAVVFNGTTYSGTGTFALPAYLGGTYTISVPVAYDNSSSLIRYLPASWNTTGFGAGPDGTFVLNANGAEIHIDYLTQYVLTVSAGPGGTTAPPPGEYWETAGNATTLSATPSPGFVLSGWTGGGSGSVNATAPTILPIVTGPVTESAQFVPYVPPTNGSFTLTVLETGLPNGTAWAVAAGDTGSGSTSGTASIQGLKGTYVVSVATVRLGPGVRYVADVTNRSLAVSSNLSLSVNFSREYLLTVIAGAGGSVSSGPEWANDGAQVALSARADPGYTFVGWNGTGAGSFGGSNASGSAEMISPITETALFAPNATGRGEGGASSGASLPSYAPWVALASLLILGLAVGYLVRRRGSHRGPSKPLPPGSGEEGAAGPDDVEHEPDPTLSPEGPG